MKKVIKYTRAPRNGREIICPICNVITRVYHFSWYSLTCSTCLQRLNNDEAYKADIYKKDWLIAEENK